MDLASRRQRAMLFVDGSNFLIEFFGQLGVERRAADRSRVHAINLAHQFHSSQQDIFSLLQLLSTRKIAANKAG